MAPEKTLPLVVITGRPNVGKSTLFNRFLHKRRSITDPTPGVTRDPIVEQTAIGGSPCLLMDTGGYKMEAPGTFDDEVRNRATASFQRAAVILLLLDAAEVTAEDEELIALLRPMGERVVAAVNKTEGGRLESNAWEYARFGFKELLCISAEHGDHFSELCDTIKKRLPPLPEETPPPSLIPPPSSLPPIRVAVLGKPNTGKSTLTNKLTRTEASIVSPIAGTTRDVIEGTFEYHGRTFRIMDTAGIRRKARVTENVEYYSVTRAIKTLDDCDIVFLVLDAAERISEQDKKLSALACERGRGIIFVLNKWDLQTGSFEDAAKDLRIMFGHMAWVPILPISAKNGTGLGEILKMAVTMHQELYTKIDTPSLNLALKDWLEAYPPPSTAAAARFKLRYLLQTGVAPLQFLLFCNKPEAIPQSYLSYLKNRLRNDLGFEHVSVQLEVRQSRKNWEDRR